jgi:hypothetical protein
VKASIFFFFGVRNCANVGKADGVECPESFANFYDFIQSIIGTNEPPIFQASILQNTLNVLGGILI